MATLRALPELAGREMLMWGDMVSGQVDLVASLPEGVTVCEWGYEGNHPFEERTARLAAAVGDLNMRVLMWSQFPGDWRAPSSEWLIDRMKPIAVRAGGAKAATLAGDVLCLHDGSHRAQNAGRTRTLAALEFWLPRWRDLGLEFATIDQAVRLPAL